MGLSKKYTRSEFNKLFSVFVENYKETFSIKEALKASGLTRAIYYSYILPAQVQIINDIKVNKRPTIIGIYKIISPTERVYIGQSIDIYKRWIAYINNHSIVSNQPLLKKSFDKYSADNHTFEIIEECEVEDLNCRERYWQEYYDVLNGGLNCVLNDCNNKPRKWSEERKKAFTGKNNPNYGKKHTEETKKKLRKRRPPMLGRKHSEETKQKFKDRNYPVGENAYNTKKVVSIKYFTEYPTVKTASEELGIARSTIIIIMSGKRNCPFLLIHKYLYDLIKDFIEVDINGVIKITESKGSENYKKVYNILKSKDLIKY